MGHFDVLLILFILKIYNIIEYLILVLRMLETLWGVYSLTRAIAWRNFSLPVGTSKPEVGYFVMKPTIFR